tara:strand:- start:463 stop:777 length:315 start_codon:yes stop_codon:yes gene_type:complete
LQFSLGGHLDAIAPDRGDQQTVVGLAGHDRGTRFASTSGGLPGVQSQASLQGLGLGRMAFEAVLDQQRSHLALEEFDLFGRDVPAALFPGSHRLVISQADDRCQ